MDAGPQGQLVLETRQSDRKLAEICRREGLSFNLVCLWRKQLLGSAEAIFGPKPRGGVDPRREKLAAENARTRADAGAAGAVDSPSATR